MWSSIWNVSQVDVIQIITRATSANLSTEESQVLTRLVVFLLLSVSLATDGLAKEAKLRRVGKPIPGEYLVVLAPDSDSHAVAAELGRRHGVRIDHVWEHALKGFAFSVMPQHGDDMAVSISNDPRVMFVEENPVTELNVSASQSFPAGDAGFWGLDRLDNVQLPWGSRENGAYTYGSTAPLVPIYVVDTGVRGDHLEFGGRVQTGFNALTTLDTNHQYYDPWPANNPCGVQPGTQPITVPIDGPAQTRTFTPGVWNEWDNGHGTAVASVAAGATYGAAKNAAIIPVTALDCRNATGSGIALVNGLEWIADTHNSTVPGVVNMSIFFLSGTDGSGLPGCPTQPELEGQGGAIDWAVDNLVWSENLVVTTSANNQNMDARCTLPARVGAAITVGGAMRNDTILAVGNIRSNFGPAVDLFGPAENIASAHLSTTAARRTISTSGTSFASPLAAGCAARYRYTYPGIDAATATTNIIYAAIPNVMVGPIGAGSNNRYLHCPTGW